MTWFDTAVATEPAGQPATAKEGIAVVCDVCGLGTEFISRTAAQRGGTEGVQRLLIHRGWEADMTTGEDACPTCTLETTGAA